MLKIGMKVLHKATTQNGTIADKWNPHLINPAVFDKDTPTGYAIITDDGVTHICTENDFEISR